MASAVEVMQMAAAAEWLRDLGEHRYPRQFALLPCRRCILQSLLQCSVDLHSTSRGLSEARNFSEAGWRSWG
jgi:hypothetical protein